MWYSVRALSGVIRVTIDRILGILAIVAEPSATRCGGASRAVGIDWALLWDDWTLRRHVHERRGKLLERLKAGSAIPSALVNRSARHTVTECAACCRRQGWGSHCGCTALSFVRNLKIGILANRNLEFATVTVLVSIRATDWLVNRWANLEARTLLASGWGISNSWVGAFVNTDTIKANFTIARIAKCANTARLAISLSAKWRWDGGFSSR